MIQSLLTEPELMCMKNTALGGVSQVKHLDKSPHTVFSVHTLCGVLSDVYSSCLAPGFRSEEVGHG